MPHGDDVGLAGAAGNRHHGQVDLVGTCLEGAHVLLDANSGGIMAVEYNVHVLAQHLAGALDGFVDVRRSGGAAGILETDGLEFNAGIKNLLEGCFIEVGVVCAGASRGKAHHGNNHFVSQSGIDDGSAAVDEVVDIV